jgi:hypothetical protein
MLALPAFAGSAAASPPRLRARPATLPARGGRVRLRVSGARGVCRFKGAARGLPAKRPCAVRLTVSVGANRSERRRIVVVRLRTHRHRLSVRIIERRRGADPPQTAASIGLAVLGAVTDPISAASAPAITSQPASESATAGTVVTFAASASGSPAPAVQWETSGDGGATWTPTSPSVAAEMALNGHLYRAVFTNSAGSVTSAAATLTVTPTSTPNFAGYIVRASAGEVFTAVAASWSVPTVTCSPGQSTFEAQWPGIGAHTSVVQAGTETNCESGLPEYYAWYDMFGDTAVSPNGYAIALPSSYAIAPGDTMSAAISITGSTWQLTLSDATANWTWTATVTSPNPPLDQSTVEWMVEDPAVGCAPSCGLPALSATTPVTFSDASATGDGGLSGPISLFSGVGAEQIAVNSTVLATPGPLDAAGDSFSIAPGA